MATLFSNNSEYKTYKVDQDATGCFIITDMEMLNMCLTLVNVDGPSSCDNPAFFDNISKKIKGTGNQYRVIGGNYIVILNADLILRSIEVPQIAQDQERELQTWWQNDLADVWREMYPHTCEDMVSDELLS